MGEESPAAGPGWRRPHTATGIQSSKARGTLAAVGHFPDTPSQGTCESLALPALGTGESHTHSSAPERAWEPGGAAQPWLIPWERWAAFLEGRSLTLSKQDGSPSPPSTVAELNITTCSTQG